METSDLLSDADSTNATSAIDFPTESKSVKRRSSQRSLSARMTHRIGIDTCISHPGISDAAEGWREQKNDQTNTFPLCNDPTSQQPDAVRSREPGLRLSGLQSPVHPHCVAQGNRRRIRTRNAKYADSGPGW